MVGQAVAKVANLEPWLRKHENSLGGRRVSTTEGHQIFDPATHKPAPFRGFLPEIWRYICALYLKLSGWRLQGDWPDLQKAVILAAPHTSNWDGILMLATAGQYRITLRFMGKKSLTEGPFGGIVKWLGCVPVDRSTSNGLVTSMTTAFANARDLFLAIPPEATRARAQEWKKGYYLIAQAAVVPIVFAVMDFATKTVRISGSIKPTGDYEADWALIRSHYDRAVGKHPANFALPA